MKLTAMTLVATLVAAPVAAEENWTIAHYGAWEVDVWDDSSCTMDTNPLLGDSSNSMMIHAIPPGQLSLSMTVRGAGVRSEEEDIVVRFDGKPFRLIDAFVERSESDAYAYDFFFAFNREGAKEFFTRFVKSNVLSVEMPNGVPLERYSLRGSAKAFSTLMDCASKQKEPSF